MVSSLERNTAYSWIWPSSGKTMGWVPVSNSTDRLGDSELGLVPVLPRGFSRSSLPLGTPHRFKLDGENRI